jgi:signal transduction histidine kinase
VPALRSLVEDFTQRTRMPADLVDFNISHDLPLVLGTTLYRITQEALRNIAKHAGATSVQISLSAAHGEIVLVIADSGSGFEPGRHGGLGLISIRERALLAGGTVRVTSVPGKGTSVQVHLPLASGRTH